MKKVYFLMAAVLLAACQSVPTSTEALARGDGYLKDGNLKQAFAAYNRAQRLNPGNAAVYASRGSAFFFSGDYEAAQKDFLKVLELNPYQADAYAALGAALAAQGDFENALQMLNVSLRILPGKAETLFSRAGIYFMTGDYEKAVADYSAVLKMRPAGEVFNARGAAYLKQGNKAAAEKDFQTAKSNVFPDKLNAYSMID